MPSPNRPVRAQRADAAQALAPMPGRAPATSWRVKSASSASPTAAGCASPSRSRTPTSSGCPTSVCRPSTGCSTPTSASSASACSCRPSRSSRRSPRGASRSSRIESQTPVRDFDVFAFSVSFEWDYTNVVTMLRLAGPRAARRPPPFARSARRDRRRRDVRESGAARAVRRRDCRRRGRAPRAVASSTPSPRPAATIGSRCSPARDRARAATCRASTTSPTTAPGGSRPSLPAPAPTRRRSSSKAAVKAADRLDPPSTEHLHARHRVRIATADRGRPRLRQPLPVLLGGLQLPARPAVFDRRASWRSPRPRGRTPPASVSSRSRSATIPTSSSSSSGSSRWATASARPRSGSTT